VAADGGFIFIEQDVCSEVRWSEVVNDIEERVGPLTILVNNAGTVGTADRANAENTPLAAWRKIFAVNVEGVFLGCRAVIPAMRRAASGSIVNISSIASHLATPSAVAYGASKAAVRHLTKSVAQHCAQVKLNVRCNSVHPGEVRTPLLNQYIEEIARQRGSTIDQIVSEFTTSVPMGDLTRAEDVAAGVAFLASDDARHVTGSALYVDGGVVHCDTFKR
jgi:NAD(P)-dependent dehydrogenase (short-subunit alcohol dehydrogenase family)